jgi:dUTPase
MHSLNTKNESHEAWLQIQCLTPYAWLPVCATPNAAILDIFSVEDKMIPPNTTTTVSTAF